VVFDFDGTLADTTGGHERALRAALREFDVELDADWYRQHVGLSIHDLLAELPAARGLPHDEIIQQSRAQLLAKLVTVTPINCVVALLRAARRAGLPCAVASGASGSLVRPGLAALGLTDEFAAIVVREDAARGKPAPDLYIEAARRLSVPVERCLAIDDAADGITSARAAGMNVLTVVDAHLAPVDRATANPERLGAGPKAHATSLPPPRTSDFLNQHAQQPCG
jgi:beta-phosphoglucomutase-like phosphatase (HAD superfamily)